MKNIFIAIGGSGTKVAEVLVGLLALGFPTKSQNGLTSVGDELEIWRVDSDQAASADDALSRRVEAYQQLQSALEDGWSMKIVPTVKDLNPLSITGNGKEPETLKGVLNPNDDDSTQMFIDLFYTEAEQQENISRGFYQKPFIGSAVMAVYADSLPNRAATLELQLASLTATPVRFFICGSLHGGTGASGVPVLGRFLREQAAGDNWKIFACLLAPYSDPPEPFISEEKARTLTTKDEVLAWFKKNQHARELLPSEDEQVEAVFQITKGFYAKNKELIPRSKHNLKYYQDNQYMAYFEGVYVVGKNQRDTLPKWSNGGKRQKNPTNSAEVVAALAALHCFAGNGNIHGNGNYIVASSTDSGASEINEEGMSLYHLPQYTVGDVAIDPEKVVLATMLTSLLVAYEHPWPELGKNEEWIGERKLGAVYQNNPGKKKDDGKAFKTAAERIKGIAQSLIGKKEVDSLGWHTDVWNGISNNLPDNFKDADARLEKFKGRFLRKADVPKLGQSKWKVDFVAFRSWALPQEQKQNFNRGAYFRLVWSKIYNGIE